MYRPGIGRRPTYWSDRFEVSLKSDLTAQQWGEAEQSVQQLAGVKQVHRRKRFMHVIINDGAKLGDVMKLVRALPSVEKVQRSGISYPAGS